MQFIVLLKITHQKHKPTYRSTALIGTENYIDQTVYKSKLNCRDAMEKC